MAALTTQSVVLAGAVPSLAAATGGGDTFTPGPNQFLMVTNGSGGSLTVTVVTPGTARGQAIADLAVAVAAGATKFIRISPADFFTDPSTGVGNITYSGATSLTVGVFQVQDN